MLDKIAHDLAAKAVEWLVRRYKSKEDSVPIVALIMVYIDEKLGIG